MPVLAELKEDIDDLEALREISNVFTEISSLKVKEIKNKFKRSSDFYDDIATIYHIVKIASEEEKMKLAEVTQKKPKKKTVSVAITTSSKFYGSLNYDLLKKFVADVAAFKDDIIVVGSVGRSYIEEQFPNLKVKEYVLFKNEIPTLHETHEFLERLHQYDRVIIYYPKFISVMSQEVGMIDITQSTTNNEEETKEKYLFEPGLDNLLDFFESQVRHILFRRTMLETELARASARLISMSTAEENAISIISDKHIELNKVAKVIRNIQLLESIAGVHNDRKRIKI